MAAGTASLVVLPTELLECIYMFLEPESILELQATSKRMYSVGNEPKIWKQHCSAWQYWKSSHNIEALMSAPVDTVNWKGLFRLRKEIDHLVSTTLDDILSTQKSRNAKIKKILDCGYDAKEELLRHCQASDSVEDVLARRYYSEAILSCIHRSIAIQQWQQMRTDDTVPLENSLAAYDMFIGGKDSVDPQHVYQMLDDLAARFRQEHLDHGEMTIRQRAIALAGFLRNQNFRGVDENAYINMRNSFIGLALRNPKHEALPLITVAIYCAVARRLSIKAACTEYPFHIYAIVEAPDGVDLDGGRTKPPANFMERSKMYMDPFRSDHEVSEFDLRQTLSSMGVRDLEDQTEYLRPASTRDMTIRSARNLHRAVQEHDHQDALAIATDPQEPESGQAFYSIVWANVMLNIGLNIDERPANALHLRQITTIFTSKFQPEYPWDVNLMEQYMLPVFNNLSGRQELEDSIRVTRAVDNSAKKPIRRPVSYTDTVSYKIGQLFQHKRYGYEGVITGWDQKCGAEEEWIQQMGVDRLHRGRHQGFYHVLVSDKSVRYVAEENIEPSSEKPTADMLKLAGRYFKRWSEEDRMFVSNVRDEYPDD